jgi:hypothetical protein
MARHISVLVTLAIVAFVSLSFFMSFGRGSDNVPQAVRVGSTAEQAAANAEGTGLDLPDLGISSDLLRGEVITPKLENATARYGLSVFPLL